MGICEVDLREGLDHNLNSGSHHVLLASFIPNSLLRKAHLYMEKCHSTPPPHLFPSTKRITKYEILKSLSSCLDLRSK